MQFDSLDYLLETRNMIFIEKELCEQIIRWLEEEKDEILRLLSHNPRSSHKIWAGGNLAAYGKTIEYIKDLMNE